MTHEIADEVQDRVPQHLGYWFGSLRQMSARMHSRAIREGKPLTQFVYRTTDPTVYVWSYTELQSRLVEALKLEPAKIVVAKPRKQEAPEPDLYELALQQRARLEGASA